MAFTRWSKPLFLHLVLFSLPLAHPFFPNLISLLLHFSPLYCLLIWLLLFPRFDILFSISLIIFFLPHIWFFLLLHYAIIPRCFYVIFTSFNFSCFLCVSSFLLFSRFLYFWAFFYHIFSPFHDLYLFCTSVLSSFLSVSFSFPSCFYFLFPSFCFMVYHFPPSVLFFLPCFVFFFTFLPSSQFMNSFSYLSFHFPRFLPSLSHTLFSHFFSLPSQSPLPFFQSSFFNNFLSFHFNFPFLKLYYLSSSSTFSPPEFVFSFSFLLTFFFILFHCSPFFLFYLSLPIFLLCSVITLSLSFYFPLFIYSLLSFLPPFLLSSSFHLVTSHFSVNVALSPF